MNETKDLSLKIISNAIRVAFDHVDFPIANFRSEAQRRWWWAQSGKGKEGSESSRIYEGSTVPDYVKPGVRPELPPMSPSHFQSRPVNPDSNWSSRPRKESPSRSSGGGGRGSGDNSKLKELQSQLAQATKSQAEQQKNIQQMEAQMQKQAADAAKAAEAAQQANTAAAQKAAQESQAKLNAMQSQLDGAKSSISQLNQTIEGLKSRMSQQGGGGGGGGRPNPEERMPPPEQPVQRVAVPPTSHGNQTPGTDGKLRSIYEDLYGQKMPMPPMMDRYPSGMVFAGGSPTFNERTGRYETPMDYVGSTNPGRQIFFDGQGWRSPGLIQQPQPTPPRQGPRGWGESRPGEMYPAVEGPGNPSWERRNPRPGMPIGRPITKPITKPIIKPITKPISGPQTGGFKPSTGVHPAFPVTGGNRITTKPTPPRKLPYFPSIGGGNRIVTKPTPIKPLSRTTG